MFEVSVESSFAAGHALREYRGKCENPHGHNYKVRVTVLGDALDNTGLLVDFKLLKLTMSQVIDRLDHQYLNDIEPFRKVNPTAENIARYLYTCIKANLNLETGGSGRLKMVRVWETDTCSATYYE